MSHVTNVNVTTYSTFPLHQSGWREGCGKRMHARCCIVDVGWRKILKLRRDKSKSFTLAHFLSLTSCDTGGQIL